MGHENVGWGPGPDKYKSREVKDALDKKQNERKNDMGRSSISSPGVMVLFLNLLAKIAAGSSFTVGQFGNQNDYAPKDIVVLVDADVFYSTQLSHLVQTMFA